MTKHILLLCLFLLGVKAAWAQQFLPPVKRFSGTKPGYLITKTGERVDFTLDDLDRKKGLIIQVSGKTLDGKPFSYPASEVQELGLAPSQMAQYTSLLNSVSSIAKVQRTKVGEATRDLILFYNEHLDNPDREVLVQLLNPDFDSQIRVYNDPFAWQTLGVGVAGVPITGGMDMSYYVKTKDGKVIQLKKHTYGEMFRSLFESCPAVMAKYGNDVVWRDFCSHVFLFEESCGLIK